MNLASTSPEKTTIAVVGAHGFIGCRACELLSRQGYQVLALTRHKFHWRHLGETNIKYIQLTEDISVDEALEAASPDIVVNAASYGAYPDQTDEIQMWESNVVLVREILEWVKRRSGVRLIHLGSSSEYGENVTYPKESQPDTPNSPYAITKSQATQLCRSYASSYGLTVTVLRLFSVFGPWEDSKRFLPHVVQGGQRQSLPPVAGTGISRDFVYVDCVVHAIHRAMEAGEGFQIFNIGSGRSTLLTEVLEMAHRIWSLPEASIQVDSRCRRPWDHERKWCADITAARTKLGWEPEVEMHEGLSLFSKWLQKHEKVYKEAPTVAVITACYNTSASLEELYLRCAESLDRENVRWFLVYVDDASPDLNERAKIKEMSERFRNVIGLVNETNRGSQSSFACGISYVDGVDGVVLLDADLQDPPELIPKMLREWELGGKAVVAVRPNREESPILSCLRRLYYRALRMTSLIQITENAGDFGLYDRSVYAEMLKKVGPRPFLRSLRDSLQVDKRFVPYVRPQRKHGVSSNNLISLSGWAIHGLVHSRSLLPLAFAAVLYAVSFSGAASWPLWLWLSLWSMIYIYYLVFRLYGRSVLGPDTEIIDGQRR